MKNRLQSIGWMCVLWIAVSFFSCGKGSMDAAFIQADSLNHQAYDVRYKDWRLSEKLALQALEIGESYSFIKAEALNNLAFCAFIQTF